MSLGFKLDGKAHTHWFQPIQHFDAWIASNDNQKSGWPRSITFSEDYSRTLREHPVPIDFRAYQELSYSSLAMDVYCWLSQRLRRVDAGKPASLSWKVLQDQFGQEYTGVDGLKNFTRKFLQALQPVLTVYPKARVKQTSDGLVLSASPSPVPEI